MVHAAALSSPIVGQEGKFMPTRGDVTRGIGGYLKYMVEKEASDLYFCVGAPVNVRIEGVNSPVEGAPLTSGQVNKLVTMLLSDDQYAEFEQEMEMNLSFKVENLGRFRVNVYRQRGEPAVVIRYIKAVIPSIEELNLPQILKDIVLEPRGLVLVVGATGSGKSTTLASMLDYRNNNKTGHIISVEDPMEFEHAHKKSLVCQREVGFDTLSYDNALRNAMREAPDMIMIGEILDTTTMRHAITYSETGHLCLSTLHANNANQALDRIINFFPQTAHHQLLKDLASHLRAIISQRLVRGVDGKRLPVVEVLLNSPHISDLIAKGDVDDLKEAMAHGEYQGMCTFDQCLFELFKNGQISAEVAIENADSKSNMQVNLNLERGVADKNISGIRLCEDKNHEEDSKAS